MALNHSLPLDPIDIRPLGEQLGQAVTSSLIKTGSLQLMRVVLRAGAVLPEHSVAGEITIQCLEGRASVVMPTRSVELAAGQLVVLPGAELHAVHAVTATSLLVTVLLLRH